MVSEKDWRNIEYLKAGNDKQKLIYRILTETNILSVLKDFDPIVVGTIPIGIDIENSDIDIVCSVSDFEKFRYIVRQNFSQHDAFSDRIQGEKQAYVANFYHLKQEIEIFAQDMPSNLQNGFRHMLIEDRILCLAGESFRQKIISLKSQGYKTEPAFGKLLNLKDPYSDLLHFENFPDQELLQIIQTESCSF